MPTVKRSGSIFCLDLGTSVYTSNLPIFGTQYHAQDIVAQPLNYGQGFGYGYKIDFTKPGAQEYINSIVSFWASISSSSTG